MKTVILCGGKGLRIRDVSNNIPKTNDTNWRLSNTSSYNENIF